MSSIPSFTGGLRFVAGDPFSMDRVAVWRLVETGTEDGTPVIERQKLFEVDCRIDSIRSRRSDIAFRTNLSAAHENWAIIFAPPDADIRNDDELRPINYPAERWNVVEVGRAQGATTVHHLEITAARIMGET